MMIFDQDGTLYPKKHELYQYTRKLTKRWLQNKLKVTSDEMEKIYKSLSVNYPNPYFGFISLGCTVNEYMSEVFDKIEPEKFLTYNPILYNFFKTCNIKKSLVTFSSPRYTKKLQNVLKITNFYSEILYVKDFKTYNKKECYKKIAKDYNLKYQEICVIGDSKENDINPAKELGCQTIWISSEGNANNIDEFIIKEMGKKDEKNSSSFRYSCK